MTSLDAAPLTGSPFEEFTRRVLAWHRVQPHRPGSMPMCSCGAVGFLCPYLGAAQQVLGYRMPWEAPLPHPDPRPRYG